MPCCGIAVGLAAAGRGTAYPALVAASTDDFAFPRPWRDLRGDDPEVSAERRRLANAFRDSFGADNPAWRTAEAVALLETTGEVLARAGDGSFILGEVGWNPHEDHYRGFLYAPDWEAAQRIVEERAG